MSQNYKLSVVVLVYNTEPYMRECLDSLVNQTLKELEIIMVNDESPDNSVAIIEEYQKKYPNLKLINQKNSGGAVAGNTGLQAASGEYVTVMDSDDVVPLDAYEKLYKKAKETEADIVIGRAHIILDGVIKEVHYKKERDVWKEEREVTNLLEFPDIFYDGFYWNKIYKRDFLFKYDCFMPPGMLYADRPMVHKAFLFANKIEIIPDVVYLWRKRGETGAKSITQLKGDINNFKDRMESLYYQINYFNEFGNEPLKTEFLKRNFDRLFFPIKSIVIDEEFKEVYLQEIKDFLSTIPNVFENDIGIVKNLYIYMILNDMTSELVEFLQVSPKGPIFEEDGNYYWALPYFRDPEVNIPDELFKVKDIQSQFISMDSIGIDEQFIRIKNISVPEVFTIEQVKIEVVSRIDPQDISIYSAKRDKKGNLSVKLPLADFAANNIYDFYVIFYSKGREERFRITKKMFTNHTKKLEDVDTSIKRTLFFAKGRLSYLVVDIKLENIQLDKDRIKISVDETEIGEAENVTFFLKDRVTKSKIYLHKRENGNFDLPWKQFMEPNHTFDFFMVVFQKGVRLHMNQVPNFQGQTIDPNGLYRELYKTDQANISLRSTSSLRRTLRKLIGKS
ncbi:glycosyltransferase [Bacillus sp. sid0103]|uniref:glycosyltransferase n=1 Tax=Bacillus sp. sid0103 TaxID=2856337 RepID=UPI001C479E6B|nr:glycosyltransferase [Bacillus sp. sid0103]MBV7505714.1 glycosyltransferase [Bacillus sp. sid0103]